MTESEERLDQATSTRIAPLSFAQQRLWMLNELYPDSHSYNTRTAYTLRGELDLRALRRSFEKIVRRHEAFRTTFMIVDGEPYQIIGPAGAFFLSVVDAADASGAELEKRLIEEGLRPFDLSNGPLMRAMLFRRGPLEHVLLISIHHIIFDEASASIFNREFSRIYAASRRGEALTLAELPIQYRDFSRWQRESLQYDDVARQKAYWRTQLANVPNRIELPIDRPRRPIARFRGAVKAMTLSPMLTKRVRDLGRLHSTTLFMTMLGAFNVLLYRYTGQSDLVIGSPIANRSRTEFESIIGFFINTIALRTYLTPDASFRDVLRQVRNTAIEAYENQDLPFERVVAESRPERNLSGTPIVNVMFAVRPAVPESLELDGLQLQRFPVASATARFDLTMRVTDASDGLICSLQYDTDLFDVSTIERLMQHYVNILDAIVDNPQGVDKPISEITMLSGAEYRSLVIDANSTQSPFPADKTIPEVFGDQVARSPDSPALLSGTSTLTYREVDEASNRLARAIADRGISRGARIGVFVDRSPGLVIALLAILKHGCAYVPLDPAYPQSRLDFIVKDSELAAVVTQASRTNTFLSGGTAHRIDLDSTAVAQQDPSALPRSLTNPLDVAYSIYTSGSTGTPKAVDVPHRAVVNLLWAMRSRPGMTAGDTLVAVTTICFDISVVELFLPLVVGAKVVIATDEVVADGLALSRLLRKSSATVMFATPVTWTLLIDAGWSGGTGFRIFCSGEPLNRALADQLLKRGAEVWNLYGPTETTVFSSAARVEHGANDIPIGAPISNTQFYILDKNGQLAPPGVAGELYIGGHGVALGYHARADLTRERFVPDSFKSDGGGTLYRTGDIVRMRASNLESLGRSDQQIKLRGFRIELGEIEASLRAQAGVADAVVVALSDPQTGPSIKAYVVQEFSDVKPADCSATLRSALISSLPRYMVPAAITIIDAIPRLPNGKVDRGSLASISDNRASVKRTADAAGSESLVIKAVSEVLEHADIQISDDLFTVGLHSVSAVRLLARLEKVVGVRLPLQTVFENPTVNGLANAIDLYVSKAPAIELTEPILELNAGGSENPLFFLHNDDLHHGAYCRRLAAAMGPSQPLYAVAPHGSAGLPALLSVEAMALNYQKLLKEKQPNGPYRVGGFCAGGMIAFELARQLRLSGEIVEHLIIVNKDSPLKANLPGWDAIVRSVGLNARLPTNVRLTVIDIVMLLPLAAERGLSAAARFVGSRIRHKLPGILKQIGRPTSSEQDDGFFIARIISATYHPKPFDGSMTLIWSSGDELSAMGDSTKGDPTLGWGAVTTGVRVVPMSGNHLSPIRERVGELGTLLSAILRR